MLEDNVKKNRQRSWRILLSSLRMMQLMLLCEVVQIRDVVVVLVVHPELVDMGIFIFDERNRDVMLVFQIVEHTVQVLAEDIDDLGADYEGHFAQAALGMGAGKPAVNHS